MFEFLLYIIYYYYNMYIYKKNLLKKQSKKKNIFWNIIKKIIFIFIFIFLFIVLVFLLFYNYLYFIDYQKLTKQNQTLKQNIVEQEKIKNSLLNQKKFFQSEVGIHSILLEYGFFKREGEKVIEILKN